jgi:hypothetical protein
MGTELRLDHVKAHVSEEVAGPEHRLNDKADAAAKRARDPTLTSVNHASWPTFTLDGYAAWVENHGYIETDLYRYVKEACRQNRKYRTHHSDNIVQLNTAAYESGTYPDYMYRRAVSDYSICTQALIRGKALYTNWTAWRRFPNSHESPMCTNCHTIETEHHIFVECPRYEEARRKTVKEMTQKIERMNTSNNFVKESLITIANSLLRNTAPWPSEKTRYYVGMIPNLNDLFHANGENDDESSATAKVESSNDKPIEQSARREDRHSIRKFIHAHAIRAAGYIWSIRMQDRYKEWRESRDRTQKPTKNKEMEELLVDSDDEEIRRGPWDDFDGIKGSERVSYRTRRRKRKAEDDLRCLDRQEKPSVTCFG